MMINPPARIYIAGPMSGKSDYNIHAFNRIEQRLVFLGFEPLNPADPSLHGKPWDECMMISLNLLRQADAVCFLYGWEESPGARIEYEFARRLGLTIFFESDFDSLNT